MYSTTTNSYSVIHKILNAALIITKFMQTNNKSAYYLGAKNETL